MDQQLKLQVNLAVEEVRQRFERWRKSRKQRRPIPENLWEEAVRLCVDHSLYQVSRSLRLDYNGLKKRVGNSPPERPFESPVASTFVELDWQAALPETEYLLEKEDRFGVKLKLQIKGRLGLDPLEFLKVFLGQGR
jgi:hypothetical protein